MIHIIIGPPCAGKSTYVAENAKPGDLKIDFDLLAECLGNAEKHNATGLVREAAFAAREAAINEALKHPECESWIIHTKPTDAQMDAYRALDADIITLDVSKEECERRAAEDGRPQATLDGITKYFEEKKGNDMEHLYKTFELKATETGTIAGYFSTYDKTPDSYGDIIEPGAFTETIKKREESGHPFPLCFNHDFSAVIGAVESVKDTEKGPFIEAKFLDTTLAQDVRKMLLSGAIYQFSFAYDVLERRNPTEAEEKAGVSNVLTKLEVFEISVVTVPANQNAVATEIKALEPETKQGRRNSKADEDVIKDAIGQLNNCIETLTSLMDESVNDKPQESEAEDEKAAPEVNTDTVKEPTANGNLEKARMILEKIKEMEN